MRKGIAAILCAGLLALFLLTFISCVDDPVQTDSLVVYNWADYIYDYDVRYV